MRFQHQFPILIAFLLIGENSLSGEKESISLASAFAKALEKNPAMATFEADRRIAEATIITALIRPNPTLETEIEDVFGSGDYRSFNSAIYNVGVSQLIETAKRRRWRGEVARSQKMTRELHFLAVHRDLITETGQRFIAALTAQEIERNEAENYRIASEAFDTVTKQIEGGRGSAVDSGQALLGKNEALLALNMAQQQAILARQRLSVMWAEQNPDFSKVSGRLQPPSHKIPSIESLNEFVKNHPAMELAEAGVGVAKNQLTLEQRKRNPNLTVGLGYRRDSSIDDNALVLGLSLPIPVFDKNQGEIARAGAAIERNQALVTQTRTNLEMSISQARARLSTAKTEYRLVSGDMLSAAEENYNTLKEGFDLGRIKYLDLLEARRTSNAVRKQKLESLGRYHSARVELEALTGEKF